MMQNTSIYRVSSRKHNSVMQLIVTRKQLQSVTWMTHLVGKKIHLYSIDGIYTVIKATKNMLEITCNSWNCTKWIFNNDFRCLAAKQPIREYYHEDPEISGLPW